MLDDPKTLEKFRRGDRVVMTAVYRKYAPIVEKTILYGFNYYASKEVRYFAGLSSSFDQQNALQEIFMRAFDEKGRHAFQGTVPYEAFLRGIARNVMFEIARHERRAGIPTEIEELEIAAPANPSGEDIELHRALVTSVRAFVKELPSDLQTLVALRFERELPQVEVARRMGLSRQNVRTLEQHVSRRLHAHLRQAGIADPKATVPTTLAGGIS